MTDVKSTAPSFDELRPHHIVRYHEGAKYFGYGDTALAAKIKSGQIPEPKYLSDDGRSRAWTGDQIIQWRLDLDAAQAARAAKAKAIAEVRAGQIKEGKAKKKAERAKLVRKSK
jgi:hypothetical protein